MLKKAILAFFLFCLISIPAKADLTCQWDINGWESPVIQRGVGRYTFNMFYANYGKKLYQILVAPRQKSPFYDAQTWAAKDRVGMFDFRYLPAPMPNSKKTAEPLELFNFDLSLALVPEIDFGPHQECFKITSPGSAIRCFFCVDFKISKSMVHIVKVEEKKDSPNLIGEFDIYAEQEANIKINSLRVAISCPYGCPKFDANRLHIQTEDEIGKAINIEAYKDISALYVVKVNFDHFFVTAGRKKTVDILYTASELDFGRVVQTTFFWGDNHFISWSDSEGTYDSVPMPDKPTEKDWYVTWW